MLAVLLFFYYQKTGSDIAFKVSPLETICIQRQNLFSGKMSKILYFKLSSAESFLPRVVSVNMYICLPILLNI